MNMNSHSSSYATNSTPYNNKTNNNNNNNNNNDNPYVLCSPMPSSNYNSQRVKVFKTLGRCGKRVEEVTRKAEVVADNIWNHLKMSPNISEAAMARLAQGTKVVAEGGYDKIFERAFQKLAGEKLLNSYACYLSTVSGPVIGTLYISNQRIAFCSDFPLSNYSSPATNPHCFYYKVMIQKEQLRKVNPWSNQWRPSEKYINIVASEGHEFWFMGFISYDKALNNLLDLQTHQISID